MTRRLTDRLADRLADRLLVRGTVEDVEPVARRMRRIRLTAPGLAWTPGQQIRLHTDGLTGPRRTYSVWDYDGTTLELRVLDHGEGPGARWSRGVRAGDEVLFSRPEGRLVTRPAAYHVFAGDETAAVAFGPMLRALGDAPAYGVVSVDEPEDRLPLDLRWHYRHGGSAASPTGLVEAVRGLELPDAPGVAYLAGEARTIQAVRAHLVRERGWPRRSVVVKPFWTPGKKGLE